MATFTVRTADLSIQGTPGNDNFVVVSGGNAATLIGLAGDDRFDFSDFNSANVTYNNGFVNGNEGRDTVNIGVETGVNFLGNFWGGGQGRDSVDIRFNSGGIFVGNTIQGGDDNDTIQISAGTAQQFSDVTINGNAGNDVIDITGLALSGGSFQVFQRIFIGGGQGVDAINVNFSADDSAVIRDVSIAGGQGIDAITFNTYNYTAEGLQINGGTFGTLDSEDGGDAIFASAYVYKNSTIAGNAGDDLIRVSGDGDVTSEVMLIAGNSGDDTIVVSGVLPFKAVTMRGGDGDDLIVAETADQFTGGQNSIFGGNGDDTISMENATGFSAEIGVTLEGGQGADLFISNSASDGTTSVFDSFGGGNFRYAEFSDSTLGESDTIVVGTGAHGGGASTYDLILPTDVSVFDGKLPGGNLVFTGGILADSGDYTSNLNLNTIVALLDANLEAGEAVGFRVDTALDTGEFGYVFVKGDGEDDLLVSFEVSTGFRVENDDRSYKTKLVTKGPNTLRLDLNISI